MMSAQHLMNLVNDILDISKIEAGKLELEQRVRNLHDVLHAAVEIVKVNAVNKNISIDVEFEDDLPGYVVGDRQQLRQRLLNGCCSTCSSTPTGLRSSTPSSSRRRGRSPSPRRCIRSSPRTSTLHFAVERHRHRDPRGRHAEALRSLLRRFKTTACRTRWALDWVWRSASSWSN